MYLSDDGGKQSQSSTLAPPATSRRQYERPALERLGVWKKMTMVSTIIITP